MSRLGSTVSLLDFARFLKMLTVSNCVSKLSRMSRSTQILASTLFDFSDVSLRKNRTQQDFSLAAGSQEP
jgi:hypothetical protein